MVATCARSVSSHAAVPLLRDRAALSMLHLHVSDNLSSEADRLRAELRELWSVYEAIYTLINASTQDIRSGFGISRANIEEMTVPALRKARSGLRREVFDLKKRYGVLCSDTTLIRLARLVEVHAARGMTIIPKYMLDQFFANYGAALKGYEAFPAHIRIGIDPGKYRTRQGGAELYLVEAALFEDLCALANLLHDTDHSDTKVAIKRENAIVRSLIEACFRFMEAYLNGMAFDHSVRHHADLSDKDRDMLTEWDSSRVRTRYISFRDKLIQYPRIISGASAPPLTEDNCPPLKYVVEKAKVIRDAIVHPSPFLLPTEPTPEKDRAFYSLTKSDAFATLDAVLELTAQIQKGLGRSLKDLWWFHRPDRTGRFPDEVFR